MANESSVEIPKGFNKIAEQHSNTGSITVSVFFNESLREYRVRVDSYNKHGEPRQAYGGPFMLADLDVMAVAFADIISMRERYGSI